MFWTLTIACSDYDVARVVTPGSDDLGDPAIAVEPAALDFGPAPVLGTPRTQSLLVRNDGVDVLTVAAPAVLGEGAAAFTSPLGGGFALEPGESLSLPVSFVAASGGAQAAELVLASSDPVVPQVRVPLTGTGEGPSLTVLPLDFDHPATGTGCVSEVPVTLRNDGTEDLVLTSIAEVEALGLSFTWPALPLTLAPGDEAQGSASFTPLAEGEVEALLLFDSNDPRGPIDGAWTGAPDGGIHEQVETVEEARDADLLFVIDNSCSMSPYQDTLADNFPLFVWGLEGTDVDWKVGVITTDSPAIRGVVDASMGDPALAFADLALVGVEGSGEEQPVDMAWQCLTQGACSAGGLLREDADLHVFMVSDERDASSRFTPEEYAAAFDALAPTVQMHVVMPLGFTDTPSYQVATLLGGMKLSIWDTDWGAELDVLGLSLLSGNQVFPLDAPIDVTWVEACVDSEPVEVEILTSVRAARLVEPAPTGARVELRYGDGSFCTDP